MEKQYREYEFLGSKLSDLDQKDDIVEETFFSDSDECD